MALEKLDGVSIALVDNSITLLMAEDVELDEDSVKTALEPMKIKIKGVKKSDSLPL